MVVIIKTAVGSPGAMALVKELKSNGVRVIGLDAYPLSAGLYCCDKGYLIPRGRDEKFLDEILRICEKEKPNMILSSPEEELLVLSKNKSLFAKKGILVLCPDYDTVKKCADKIETDKVLRSCEVPVPKIYDTENTKFPCIIKPRFGKGSENVFKAESQQELEIYVKKVENPIIQEYLDGKEFSVDVLADLEGKVLSIVPRIRILTESGISLRGVTVRDENIIQYCKKITKNLRLIGPSCIQCFKNKNGIKFIEINTRFGGGSILSIKANPNIISNLIKLAKGDTPEPDISFKEGLTMTRFYDEVFLNKDEIL